jgi:hypothetical protein
MIVNFVFSNSLVYFFILILKEIIFMNPTMWQRQFFRVGNTLTFAASPLFHPLSISSPSQLDTHKKQPLLSFLSLLSTKKVFSSWKSRLHDMFRCHSYIWLFIKVAISQNVFE